MAGPRIKDTLSELGVLPRKSRGQNFLLNPAIADRIAASSGVSADDAVLEIGPGLGMLTQSILKRTSRLCAVELEQAFCSYLRERFFAEAPERVICADIRTFSPEPALESLSAEKLIVLSNVPYSISSEVVLWLIEHRQQIRSASLLLQEEFARRIAAAPGTRECGSLTIMRALFADAEIGDRVGGDSFHPPAAVDSLVLRLDLRETPRLPVDDPVFFSKVVRAAFGQRRKTLLNSLNGAGIFGAKAELAAVLDDADISGQRRAETLSLEEFVRLSAKLAGRMNAAGI